jgi:uncharacterized protein (DUF305 family)
MFKTKTMCDQAISSDCAFLEHMIIHHKVGVGMARQLQSKSMNSAILEYLRDLIRQQEYEITVMGSVNRRGLPQRFSNDPANKLYDSSKFEYYHLVGQGSSCDAHMFHGCCDSSTASRNCHSTQFSPIPEGSSIECRWFQPMQYHNTTPSQMEIEFLTHMIAHHQIAVDVSRVMITKTDSPHIMSLCYDIIRAQEHEIAKMRDLLSWVAGWQFPSNCF